MKNSNMRKIHTKQEEEKRKRRNNLILGAILIFVMFGSTFGIIVNSFGDNSNTQIINYKGEEFYNSNGFWNLEKGEFNFLFRHDPRETGENIKNSSDIKLLNNYFSKPLYISSEDDLSNSEILNNLFYSNNIILRAQFACLDNQTCEGDVPIKDCSENFIIIRPSNESSIHQEQNCVFIEGPAQNLTLITDEFLLKIIGL